jgi:hypothetical protein
MAINPYQTPADLIGKQTAPSQPWLILALVGLSLGMLCASFGAFIGGGLSGYTYRTFHDVVRGGGGIFGLFNRKATPVDFALFHGTLAVLPLTFCGAVLGFLQGVRAARCRLGNLGIFVFAVAGLVLGLLNGALATGGPAKVVPQFVEGPLAGGLFGATTAALAWLIFRLRMNVVAQRPKDQQVTILLVTLLAISGPLLVLLAMIPVFAWGSDALQIVMRFATIILLAVVCGIVLSLLKRRVVPKP